jgi:outer membrane protein assembly factor BamD (BamD/ComL family)
VVSLPARRARTTAASEDTAPVLEAMRALRVEQNPARARVLLARYLDRYPRGTLVEEALAMSIEAAIARGDADAAALGARYLKLYPAGPFRALARQAVARASSASTSAR